MNATEALLLKLLSSHIHQRTLSLPDSIDHDTLKTLVKAHGLMPLAYHPLKHSQYPIEYLKPYKDALMHHTLIQTQQEALLGEVFKQLDTSNIEVCIFKGSVLKTLYPNTSDRTMGDIDFLYKSKDQTLIHKILTDLDFTLVSQGEVHDLYKKAPLIIEPHTMLFAPEHEEFHRYFKAPFNHTHNQTLEPTYHYLYLIAHIAKHFKSAGSGLRNLLDMIFFTKHYEQTINPQTLNEGLSILQLTHFHQTLLHVIAHYLDYQSPFMQKTFNISLDTKSRLMDFIIHSGTYGFNQSEQIDQVRVSLSKNRLTYYFSKLFPKRKALQYQYPRLSQKRLYYPLMVVHRFFKLLKNKPTRNRIKALKTSKKTLNEFKRLYQDIGLE